MSQQQQAVGCPYTRGYLEELHFNKILPQPYEGSDADRLIRCFKCQAPYSTHREDRAYRRDYTVTAATTMTLPPTRAWNIGSVDTTTATTSSTTTFQASPTATARESHDPVNRRLDSQLHALSPELVRGTNIQRNKNNKANRTADTTVTSLSNSTNNAAKLTVNKTSGMESSTAAPQRRKVAAADDPNAEKKHKRQKGHPSIERYLTTRSTASTTIATSSTTASAESSDILQEPTSSWVATDQPTSANVDNTQGLLDEDYEAKYDDDDSVVAVPDPQQVHANVNSNNNNNDNTKTGDNNAEENNAIDIMPQNDEEEEAPHREQLSSQQTSTSSAPDARYSRSAAASTPQDDDDNLDSDDDDDEDGENNEQEEEHDHSHESDADDNESDDEGKGDPASKMLDALLDKAYKRYNEVAWRGREAEFESVPAHPMARRRTHFGATTHGMTSAMKQEAIRLQLRDTYTKVAPVNQLDKTPITITPTTTYKTTPPSKLHSTTTIDLPILQQLLKHTCHHRTHLCHYPNKDDSQGTYAVTAIRGHRDFIVRGKLVRRYLVLWREDDENHIDCVLGSDFATPCITVQYDKLFPRGQAPHTFLAADPSDVTSTISTAYSVTSATITTDSDLKNFTASGNPTELNDDMPMSHSAFDSLLKQEMVRLARYQAKLRVRASQQIARLCQLRGQQSQYLADLAILRTEAALAVCRSNINVLASRLGYCQRYPTYEDAARLATTMTARMINTATLINSDSPNYHEEDFKVIQHPIPRVSTTETTSSRPTITYYQSTGELTLFVSTADPKPTLQTCRLHRVLAERVTRASSFDVPANFIWCYHRAVSPTDQWFYYLSPDPDVEMVPTVTPAVSHTTSTTIPISSSVPSTIASSSTIVMSTTTKITGTTTDTTKTTTSTSNTTMTTSTESSTATEQSSTSTTQLSTTTTKPRTRHVRFTALSTTTSSNPLNKKSALRSASSSSQSSSSSSSHAEQEEDVNINMISTSAGMNNYTPAPTPLISIPTALTHTAIRQMQLGFIPSMQGYTVTPGRQLPQYSSSITQTIAVSTVPTATTITPPHTPPQAPPPPSTTSSTAPTATTAAVSPPTCICCLEDLVQLIIQNKHPANQPCPMCNNPKESHFPRSSHPLYQSAQPPLTTTMSTFGSSTQIFTASMINDGWPIFRYRANDDRSANSYTDKHSNRMVHNDALSFMEHMWRTIQTRNLPRTHWEMALVNACKDDFVQRWLESNIVGKGLSWPKIEDLFINQYTRFDDRAKWQRELDTLNMKNPQYKSVERYCTQFCYLVQRLSYNPKDISIVEKMERGLTSKLRAELQREKQGRLLCQVTANPSTTTEVAHSTVFVFQDIYALSDTLVSLQRTLQPLPSYGPSQRYRQSYNRDNGYKRGYNRRRSDNTSINKLEMDQQGQPRNVNKKHKNRTNNNSSTTTTRTTSNNNTNSNNRNNNNANHTPLRSTVTSTSTTSTIPTTTVTSTSTSAAPSRRQPVNSSTTSANKMMAQGALHTARRCYLCMGTSHTTADHKGPPKCIICKKRNHATAEHDPNIHLIDVPTATPLNAATISRVDAAHSRDLAISSHLFNNHGLLYDSILADTGADCSCINNKLVQLYNLQVKPPQGFSSLTAFDGSKVSRIGTVTLRVTVHCMLESTPTIEFDKTFEVIESKHDFILGRDVLPTIFPNDRVYKYCKPPAQHTDKPSRIIRGTYAYHQQFADQCYFESSLDDIDEEIPTDVRNESFFASSSSSSSSITEESFNLSPMTSSSVLSTPAPQSSSE